MSTIGPVDGSAGSYSLPQNNAELAGNMRQGISSFSESIQHGNPENENDLDAFGKSILNINKLTGG